jgi:hypothetical protein
MKKVSEILWDLYYTRHTGVIDKAYTMAPVVQQIAILALLAHFCRLSGRGQVAGIQAAEYAESTGN